MEIKNVNDYVDLVHELFPELNKEEIKRILVYGLKMILLYVSAGNDISIISKELFLFIGKIPTKALSVFKNYSYKLSKRIAYMFRRTLAEWDGYYYFSRSESLYMNYLKLNRKKIKTFKNVYLYKLLDELKVRETSNPYIFRLKEDKTDWLRKYYPEIKTKNAELIIQRDSYGMKDILTSENKFKYIQ